MASHFASIATTYGGFLLSREFLERENWGCHHMAESVHKQIGILAAIKSEAHFFQIGGEMFRANFVPRPNNATLEERESRFHGIRVNVSVHVFISVADCLMQIFLADREGPWVDRGFVRDDHIYILANILSHDSANGLRRARINMNKPQFATALTYPDHYIFLAARSPFAGFAANVGFVNFDYSAEQWLLAFDHCSPYAMAEIPCRFVTDSKRPLNLAGRHSLFGLTKQVSGSKPFIKGEMRIIENGARRDGELIAA